MPVNTHQPFVMAERYGEHTSVVQATLLITQEKAKPCKMVCTLSLLKPKKTIQAVSQDLLKNNYRVMNS
jgi:hypothetical protein